MAGQSTPDRRRHTGQSAPSPWLHSACWPFLAERQGGIPCSWVHCVGTPRLAPRVRAQILRRQPVKFRSNDGGRGALWAPSHWIPEPTSDAATPAWNRPRDLQLVSRERTIQKTAPKANRVSISPCCLSSSSVERERIGDRAQRRMRECSLPGLGPDSSAVEGSCGDFARSRQGLNYFR